MSKERGFVKIYRDMLDHWVFEDPVTLKIWMFAVLMANHKEKEIRVNGDIVLIQRGQFWTSIRKFSERTGFDKNTVTKALDLMQNAGMIYRDSQKGVGTLITVRNYGVYQGFSEGVLDTISDTSSDTISDTSSDTLGTLSQTQSQTHPHHKQEYIRMSKNEEALNKNEKEKNQPPPAADLSGDYSNGNFETY